MQEILWVMLAYLIGAIPFSYLFTRLLTGIDIREKGSGNVGSTNVLRTVGIRVALAAFAGDMFKGVLVAWLGMYFGGYTLAAACSLAAVIGHCWPVFLNFQGGKGVATSAGVMLYLLPQAFLILFFGFIAIIAISRYVSLGSICGATLFPFMFLIFDKPQSLVVMGFMLAVLVIYRHRENIQRLRNGSESKIGKKVA